MKEKRTEQWWITRLALTIVGNIEMGKLNRASKNGKKTLARTLRNILDDSQNTVYGKEHHFEEILRAKTPDELFTLYQKHIKISDYEDFRPYVDRHKNGEANILFPGKPILYATTSGTTKEPKWVPITERYYQTVYRKLSQFWYYCF